MFAVLSISTAVRSSQRFPWETLCPGGHSSTANSMRDSQTAGGREENTEAAVGEPSTAPFSSHSYSVPLRFLFQVSSNNKTNGQTGKKFTPRTIQSSSHVCTFMLFIAVTSSSVAYIQHRNSLYGKSCFIITRTSKNRSPLQDTENITRSLLLLNSVCVFHGSSLSCPW